MEFWLSMKIYNKSKGFTLAEIMIVLLILTIVFAAFAPLMTKKQKCLHAVDIKFGHIKIIKLWMQNLIQETKMFQDNYSLG